MSGVSGFERVFPTTATRTPGAPSAQQKIGPLTERQAAIVGIAVVVGLGLYAAKKNAANAAAAGTTDSSTLGTGAYAGTSATGAASYDSTVNDLYDSIEPQVSAISAAQGQLSGTLTKLPGQIGAAIKSALPKPAKPGKPTAHKPAKRPKKPKPKPRPAHPGHPAKKK